MTGAELHLARPLGFDMDDAKLRRAGVDYRDQAEPTGLEASVLADPRITTRVRIPMRPGMRPLNLANAAAVAVYEAWRQLGHPGAGR